MVNFFLGCLAFIVMFAVCFAVCAGVWFFKNRFRVAKTPVQPDSPPENDNQTDSAKPQQIVYYITKQKPKPKKKRPKTHTIPIKGAIAPKGTVVITAPEIIKNKPTPKRKSSTVKPESEVKQKRVSTTDKAVSLPSRPRPKAVRGDKTTSARR